MIERTFNITRKINATKEQWDALDTLVKSIVENDINGEILCVLIDTADIKDGVLSEVFTPVVETAARVSFELEEAVVFNGTIDWVTREFPIGYETVTIWRREGC